MSYYTQLHGIYGVWTMKHGAFPKVLLRVLLCILNESRCSSYSTSRPRRASLLVRSPRNGVASPLTMSCGVHFLASCSLCHLLSQVGLTEVRTSHAHGGTSDAAHMRAGRKTSVTRGLDDETDECYLFRAACRHCLVDLLFDGSHCAPSANGARCRPACSKALFGGTRSPV